jgi:hypothetical protein
MGMKRSCSVGHIVSRDRQELNQLKMPNEPTVLYDTERLPLLIRLPFLLIGICCFLALVDFLGDWLFGLRILFASSPKTSNRVIFAAICLGLAIQLWSQRRRILWYATDEYLVIEERLLFWDTQQWIARELVSSIQIRPGRTKSGPCWNIYAYEFNGRKKWLTRTGDKEEASEIAGRIAQAIDRPSLN